jgi:hypothetical protein
MNFSSKSGAKSYGLKTLHKMGGVGGVPATLAFLPLPL